ncbi:hypothetical protein [Nocardia sp. alder85J]|uniref:hypothetical protein n=1 Tax=Nocardia sp. alder85J TaxID=2862949 RepID=UPI001CD38878|nr:hypothetical protein [Nocardia sp. alder85J]MCX4098406.1 hypothetical protein [Nocardia sp. alder85J]
MINESVFAGPGIDIHVQPHQLGTCYYTVALPGGGPGYFVMVTVGDRLVPEYSDHSTVDTVTHGDVQMSTPKNSRDCKGFLYSQPGSQYVEVLAGANNAAAPGADKTACLYAHKGLDAAASAITARHLPRIGYPADSTGSVDLCALIPATEIATLAHRTSVTLSGTSNRHACRWITSDQADGPDTGWPAVSIVTNLVHDSGSGSATSTIINGHTVVADRLYGTCSTTIDIRGRDWPQWPGRQVFGGPDSRQQESNNPTTSERPDLVEWIEVDVNSPNGLGTAGQNECDEASALTTELTALLPQPR